MIFIDFLYYHAKLLGKRRSTSWDDYWLSVYGKVIMPIFSIYIICILII